MNRFGNISKFVGEFVSAWNEEKPSRVGGGLGDYCMFLFVAVGDIVIKVAGIFLKDQQLYQQI